ncbi:aspartate/tyrosine/aromatic aminotransferase [Maricurvus nonylphenolicus]|uniref:amino acid aminotransferase n=1 Tax=Maricurvus nonylphenolicus TaxID=1008307 RepID=UPI0036F3A830
MFEQLQALPADPILGLSAAYQQDTNPLKVDLGVGVYKDEQGNTPVLSAIRKAQQRLHTEETSKAYLPPVGPAGFNEQMQNLIFGADHTAQQDGRVHTVQTPGGCGALRVAAELIQLAKPGASIWVSTPTWANHVPLLGSAGLQLKEYPYYDADTQAVNFDAMMASLEKVPAGDLVLLHGCCHNPCGTDLDQGQWQQVAELANKNGFTPFIDMAYQGFGDSVEEDAYGVRLLAEKVPELLVASSCSKNFGLYRERTGAISFMGSNATNADNVKSQILKVARGIYSMPPSHGAQLVDIVLGDSALHQQWLNEVAEMRERIKDLREALASALASTADFSFIPRQRGMFSFLGLSPLQVQRLREEFSVYMVDSSRINIAGINQKNLAYLADSIAKVL